MTMPKFTYESYRHLLNTLKVQGYLCSKYDNYTNAEKSVILRHDVDLSIEKAYKFAEIESRIGLTSTYFFLISTDFYNISSKKNRELIGRMHQMGHSIGLHYDEQAYTSSNVDIINNVQKEAKLLSNILGIEINLVSMHRPSKDLLQQNIEIPGLINSYSMEFFSEMKYISDSRRYWRENPYLSICSGEALKLHLLVHPFWYNDCELSIEQSIQNFLQEAKADRLRSLENNISDLKKIIKGG